MRGAALQKRDWASRRDRRQRRPEPGGSRHRHCQAMRVRQARALRLTSGGVGPIAPPACHKSSKGSAPRLTIGAAGNAPSRSGSSTNPSATGTLLVACASSLSPSGKLSASALISARPVIEPSRRASAAGERSSCSANNTSIAIAAGRPLATASTSRAIVARGHGQAPNASMDERSMSTTITFKSDATGLRKD